jgi:3-hydroxyacyl-[acyl-carrier-protein] dehydratase
MMDQHPLEDLPHGHEFRFIDYLVDIQAGKSGTASYTLPTDAHFLKGHFPGNPLMPGVLMIEAVAQLAGIVAQCDPDAGYLENLRLTSVRAAKIRGTIPPQEEIIIQVEIAGRMGGLIQATGKVTHDNQEIASVQVTLSGDLPAA